jgi:hypothetical protein
MWFRKQSAQGASGRPRAGGADGFLITEDMLIRGTVSMRRGKPIRQIGVTVNGSTVLVTTGDTVSLDTFEALVAVGAVAGSRPPSGPKGAPPQEDESVG